MGRDSRGSATVEMVLLSPVLMTLVMLIVHVHRLTDVGYRVARAADVGARAASMSRTGMMEEIGIRAARADLDSGSRVCSRASVSAVTSRADRYVHVAVTVSCEPILRGLGLLGIGRHRITKVSTEVVDYYRGR